MPLTGYFTGSGATGAILEEFSYSDFYSLISDHRTDDAAERERLLLRWKNPGESDGYMGMHAIFSDATRRISQAEILLGRRIARNSELSDILDGIDSVWVDRNVRSLVVNANGRTRREFLTDAASKYNIERELLGAIILAEQRDQSEAEDIADFTSAYYTGYRSSIGLGQINIGTARTFNLLGDIFTDSMWSPWRFSANTFVRILADEAVNILATAKYIRMLADLGSAVQRTRNNRIHDMSPSCPNFGNGNYIVDSNKVRDLSVLTEHSREWTILPDTTLPETVPTNVIIRSTGLSLPISNNEWNTLFRGRYYVRLIGMEYTSCPFDPQTLQNGISVITESPTGSGNYFFNDNTVFATSISWGAWVAIAFEDMIIAFGNP